MVATALVRAPTNAILPTEGAHCRDLISHVVDLGLDDLPDFLQLVDVALIVGGEGVEQIAHIIAQTGDHLFQLIATALKRLASLLICENFIDE